MRYQTNATAIQITNTYSVTIRRLLMIHRAPTTDRIGISGYGRTLKLRGRSGARRRRIMTPMDTVTNATRVPTLVISARKLIGMKPASSEITTATMMVLGIGVRVRGFTLWNTSGIMPSRDIANRMRVWPYTETRVTLKIEMIAPAASTVPGQDCPVTSSRIFARPASWPSNWPGGCAPMATSATSTYITVTVTNEIRMASGRLRCGFLASSPAAATPSNPTNVKKMTLAAVPTPAKPYGANGCMLDDLNPWKPMMMNITSTA